MAPDEKSQYRLCMSCRHRRRRPEIVLFGPSDLQTAGILKERVEWDNQRRQRAEQEAQRLTAGLPFTYEPHHYDWCAAHTKVELVERARGGDQSALNELMVGGGAEMNPVTGEISPIYLLCAQLNPEGACQSHEPK